MGDDSAVMRHEGEFRGAGLTEVLQQIVWQYRVEHGGPLPTLVISQDVRDEIECEVGGHMPMRGAQVHGVPVECDPFLPSMRVEVRPGWDADAVPAAVSELLACVRMWRGVPGVDGERHIPAGVYVVVDARGDIVEAHWPKYRLHWPEPE